MTNVFSTRRLKPSASREALAHGIKITEACFIRIEPILSKALKKDIFSQLNRPHQTLLFSSKNAAAIAIDHYLEDIPEKITATWKYYCLSGATKQQLLTYFPPSGILAEADNANQLIDKMSGTTYSQ